MAEQPQTSKTAAAAKGSAKGVAILDASLDALEVIEERVESLLAMLIDEKPPGPDGVFPTPCTTPPADPAGPSNPNAEYRLLAGAQVEPTAGWWTSPPPPPLRVVPLSDVQSLTEDPSSEYFVPPYPRDKPSLDWEIQILRDLQDVRDDPDEISGTFAAPPASYPSVFLTPPTSNQAAAANPLDRLEVSDFIQLRPPPFGAIFRIGRFGDRRQPPIRNINQQHLRRQQFLAGNLPAVVRTGRQLARMFQDETPGLLHRHALNYLLYKRTDISPPRQARIWMALDVAIYSALVAVWHYKWAASKQISYRQRPYEYDQDATFRVLYDDVVGDRGRFDKCARPDPCPSPGTPRHPAYGSGHSTYSAAASRVLSYFFPAEADQFTRLANNIGIARLWGGVHWLSDHIAGVRIGSAVATRVIEQLEADCVPPPGTMVPPPCEIPPQANVQAAAAALRNGPCAPGQDTLDTQRDDQFPDCEPMPCDPTLGAKSAPRAF